VRRDLFVTALVKGGSALWVAPLIGWVVGIR